AKTLGCSRRARVAVAARRLLSDARMLLRVIVSAIAIATTACAAADGADPDMVGEAGKLLFTDGTADAFRALRVANTLTAASLQHDAKLTASASRNLVARRAGADGVDGTADDRPFYTLAELDAVRDVGAGSINRLAAYGRAHVELLGASLRVD